MRWGVSVQTSGTTLKASFEDASDAVMDAQWYVPVMAVELYMHGPTPN